MIKELLKKNTTLGLRNSVRRVLDEYKVSKMHLANVQKAKKYAGKKDLKLNLGCGFTIKPGWVNVDFNPKCELSLDLREKLPLDDNSCEMIYSEHFFEHLGYPDETGFLLKESLRVLKPGGTFSVGVPDTEWPLLAYGDSQKYDYFDYAKKLFHPWCDTKLQHINEHFRQNGEHKYAWDFETMESVLQKLGYVNIKRRNFNPELDSEKRQLGTLYVDAQKPN